MADISESGKDRYFKILVITSIVFCAFHLFLHAREPAIDGDSFEYAGIARNLFLHGAMREDLLRSYTIQDQPLPHPPSQRANLYSIALVPFYTLFRDTQWTFLAPVFIGLFLLPLVTYRVGGRWFGRDAAFIAALLSLFAPGVLRLYAWMDPGLPEAWQMIFYLLFFSFLLGERYAAAGAVMALAFLFKQNSFMLIPSAVLWMFIFRRRHLFGVQALKLFAVAGIIVLPFLIRSYIVFGSPFHNEQFQSLSRPYAGLMVDRVEQGDIFGVIFNYEAYNEMPLPDNLTFAVKASNFLKILRINVWMALFGSRTAIFYIPGIFQTFGLLLLPFIVLGAVSSRGRPETGLSLIVIFLQCALHILMAAYSDRYILCLLPLAFLLCGRGLVAFQQQITAAVPSFGRRSVAWSVALFFLISESAGFVSMNAMRMLGPAEDNKIREVETICSYLKENTPGDSVVMTYPFFSTHFLCNRFTVPIPYGSVRTMAKVAKKYGAGHVIYMKTWPGDLFFDLPFGDTVVRGRHVSLFRVTPGKLDGYLANHSQYPVDTVNPVAYFLSNRFNMELSPPTYKILGGVTHGRLLGVLIYLALAAAFAVSWQRRGISGPALTAVPIALAVVVLSVWQIATVMAPFQKMRPQISRIQAEVTLRTFPKRNLGKIIVIDDARAADAGIDGSGEYLIEMERKKAALAAEDLKPFFGSAVTGPGRELEKAGAPATGFVPVQMTTPIFLADYASFAANMETQEAMRREAARISSDYAKKGFTAVPIHGGVFIYR